MKISNATIVASWGLLYGLLICSPTRVMAQAAPGPLPVPPQSQSSQTPRPKPIAKPKPPEVPPRKTLDGPWKFNRDESDDPRTRIQDSRGTKAGGNSGGRGPGGGYPGGGYPGGPFPGGGGYPGGGYPSGSPGGGRGGRDTETDEKLEQLIRPPNTLNFVIKTPEVDLTDDSARKLAIFTDGRKLQKSKDDSYQEIAAHWDGTRLVTDEKSPQGAKMRRTFELSPDGRQFYENIHVDRGKSKGELTIRYVYDVSSGHESELTHETDPNQPVMKRRADDTANTSNPQSSQTGQGSDPDQPVMKRRADDTGSTSSPQDTQNTPAVRSEPACDEAAVRRAVKLLQ